MGSVQDIFYRVFDSLLRFVQKTLTLTFRDRSQFRGGGGGGGGGVVFRTGGIIIYINLI